MGIAGPGTGDKGIMRKTYLKKNGKRYKINREANKKLKELFTEKRIRDCEIGLEGCCGNYLGLQFCHRKKRSWYYSRPELLSDFKQVVLGCPVCHNRIEHNPKLTEEVFKRLRPEP